MAINLVQNSKDVEIAQLKAELEEIKSRPLETGTPLQATTYQEQDDRDEVQKELDSTEEFILNNLFPNGIKVSPMIKTYLTIKGKSEVDAINEMILSFEKYARPFLSPDGTLILTGKPSELIRLAQPLLQQLGKIIGG